MKHRIIFRTFFAAALAIFSIAFAQAQSQKAPAKVEKNNIEKAQRRQQHDEKWAKELNLTPEQQAQFKKIDEEHSAKAKAARSAKKEEAEKLRAERIAAHKSVLTKEQAAKYDEIQAKKAAKREDRQAKKADKKAAKKAKKTEKKAIKEELDKQ